MQPFATLDSFETPEGRTMTLHARGEAFYIRIDGEELMSTRRHSSERALAELTCPHYSTQRRPVVLIGGLGLGFTVGAALEILPGNARVEVAEVFPEIARWNREHADTFGKPLSDRRVHLREQDVCAVIAAAKPDHYAAIMLDVDNGPEASSLASNRRLYTPRGLGLIRRALAPGGTVAVWSADAAPQFANKLRRQGFETEVKTVRSHRDKGPRFTIFLGRRPA